MTYEEALDKTAQRVGYKNLDDVYKMIGGHTIYAGKGTQFEYIFKDAAELYAKSKAIEMKTGIDDIICKYAVLG